MATPANPTHLTLAVQTRNVFVWSPRAGTKVEEMLAPGYWTHVAKMLHISDRIEVIPEDGEYFAELFVEYCDAKRATVRVLRVLKLGELDGTGPTEDVDTELELEVKWRGATLQHVVQYVGGKTILHEGCATRDVALAWLETHRKTNAG